jgi:leucyl aminopeptidase
MFAVIANLKKRKQADLLVLPLWKTKTGPVFAAECGTIPPAVRLPLESKDFLAKENEILFLYVPNFPEKRVALVGLGQKEKITTEKLRRSYAALVKECIRKKVKSLNLIVPEITSLPEGAVIRGICEGLLLTNYLFDQLKHDVLKENPTVLIQKMTLITPDKNALENANKIFKIIQGVHYARDLVNGNADDITPQYLAQCAQDIAKKFQNVKATIFDKNRIIKEKMGLLLAVNRGSSRDPVLIILEYRGNPKSKDLTVLVGKGVTYDTGGLNIKTPSGMETMKADMGGAATVLGTLIVAATLKLAINLTVVVPATENCIDGKSYKPGDVYTGYSGKTVEITNTDAEGRLVLADALAYVNKNLKPTRIIDFATLTGGVDVALGAEASGLMSNDDALADGLIRAGSETYERVWRLPLYEEYKDQLKSDFADIKNAAYTRSASPIIGATFLEGFIDKTPWAHLDIASTAYLSEARRYHPKYATGIGVRLMIEFLEHL